eukprot:CAMPEP_0174309766 /NCGR_PEP_ID=MMETSP0810-20121108/2621_1 /TAXON_ID=73025 ORGANISM="Eutreptiella gymnastica-like, Strain CCMP1594" /NCGR_SAMPLE_ID=MMETSP0810 /ASSEMBLY_ACC=CAM_ASM_000659 /LENGTH=319 /DNA_ID=CAMNT_0015417493 /DNA_START=92 /DNA_END=1051 /DNA_ORIENTATION=+
MAEKPPAYGSGDHGARQPAELTGSRQYDTDDQFAATLPGDKKACLLGEALELQSRAPRPTSPRVELSASFANTSGSFNVPARVVASGSPKKDADPVPITEDTLPGAPVDPLPGAVESQSPAPEAQTNIMPPSTQPPSAEALKDLQYTDDYKDSNGACPGQDGFKPPTWHSEHFKQLRKTWPTGLDADAYDIFYRDSNGLRVGTAGFKPPGDKKRFKERQYDDDYVDPNGRKPREEGFLPPWWLDDQGQVLQCKSAKGLKANAHDPFNYNQQVGTCSIKSPTIQLVIWVVVLTVVSALVGLVVWYFKLEEKLPKTAMPMP